MHRFVANSLLLLASLLLSAIVAEGVIRLIDEVPLFAAPLPRPVGDNSAISRFDDVPLAASVKRDWFFLTPPPLPNRTRPREDLDRWSQEAERAYAEHGNEFRSGDMFAAATCSRCGTPFASAIRAPRGSSATRRNAYSSSIRPTARPIRTTGSRPTPPCPTDWSPTPSAGAGRQCPFNVGLAPCASSSSVHRPPSATITCPTPIPSSSGIGSTSGRRRAALDIRFETMNAARESIGSPDIAAIVRQEVLPLLPDLVLYYEGANQFRLNSLVADLPDWTPQRPVALEPRGRFAVWLQQAERYSAIARRLATATGWLAQPTSGEELPKPAYDLVWPTGLDERDPDLSRQDLPVHLSIILRDLDEIRADLAAVGAEFAVSSFKWMVSDGMKLDPVRQRYTLDMLNASYGPFRYRDLARPAGRLPEPRPGQIRQDPRPAVHRCGRHDAVRSRPFLGRHPQDLCRRANYGMGVPAATRARHRTASGERRLAPSGAPNGARPSCLPQPAADDYIPVPPARWLRPAGWLRSAG
jgi:hypothetical protein